MDISVDKYLFLNNFAIMEIFGQNLVSIHLKQIY